jgi:8-oxo-dGTP diphosphatase
MNPSVFSGKVRVRVNGILTNENSLLLIKHINIGALGYLWSPPGGGVNFGESLEHALIREFKEETNLDIEVGDFLFVNEHIDQVHHAIEIFYAVKKAKGILKMGTDPELEPDSQYIDELRFLNDQEIKEIPKAAVHRSIIQAESINNIFNLNGLFSFGKR